MYHDSYEEQQDQARQEYYIMGVTDGGNGQPIGFTNDEYLTGYKHGLFSALEASIDDMALAMTTSEPPF